MEGIENGRWLAYVVATITGQGMKLEEGSCCEPFLLVLHLVSTNTGFEGEVENALLGLSSWIAGGWRSIGYVLPFLLVTSEAFGPYELFHLLPDWRVFSLL